MSSGRNPSRNRLSTPAAEQIAVSADRLEARASEVRPLDKGLALKLLKEATKLRAYARALDIQHKRAVRVVAQRAATGRNPAREPAASRTGVPLLATDAEDDDASNAPTDLPREKRGSTDDRIAS